MATASGEAAPTSSNAITIKRRQMAEPFCAKSVNAARCAVATSPRRMDFCSRLIDDPLICHKRLDTEFPAADKLLGKTLFGFGECVVHQRLRESERTEDVNF